MRTAHQAQDARVVRAGDFQGADVTCGGQSLGVVRDLVLAPSEGALAFRLQAPGTTSEQIEDTLVVPFEAACACSPQAILLASADDVLPATKLPRVLNHLRYPQPLIGMPVYGPRGCPLAFVQDVLLDRDSGRLVGYMIGALPSPERHQHLLKAALTLFVLRPGHLRVQEEGEALIANLLHLQPEECGRHGKPGPAHEGRAPSLSPPSRQARELP